MATPPNPSPRLRLFSEVLGLSPPRERLRQTLIAVRGEEDVPPSRAGLSSLQQLRPGIGLPLWLGRERVARKVIVSNLFNHTQTPITDGWSVRRTQVRDFRGRDLTYDSHNGTDFAIPVGTPVLAAAPGRVSHIVSEFNRGGLKILIDHGEGLMTLSAHLARPLVRVGDIVGRRTPIALSGYSGLDAASTFPWGVPHIHFNVWLNAEPTDPFPCGQGESMWLGGGRTPVPADPHTTDDAYTPFAWSASQVEEAIAACLTARSRERLRAVPVLEDRAAQLVCEMNYYPTRFPRRVNPWGKTFPRRPVLSLPFEAERFDGVVLSDEI